MTTDTTAAENCLPRRPRWLIPGLIGLVLVLHIVVLLLLRPFGISTMMFDREEEEQRTAEVQARQAERLAAEQKRRESIQLEKPDAEKLRQEEVARRKPLLQKNLVQLREVKREIEAQSGGNHSKGQSDAFPGAHR